MSDQCVAIFGATGRTGACVVDAFTRAGCSARALARSPGALSDSPAAEVSGELTDPDAVDATLNGCVAACLVFGPRPPHTDAFCAEATESIVSGMKRCGVPRIVCQTGAMIGSYSNNRTAIFELVSGLFRRRQPEAHEDRVRQEDAVRSSGLDWTVVKPPRLTMGGPSRRLRMGPDVKVGLMSSVSRQDLGTLIVREVIRPQFSGVTVFVRG